MNLMRLLRRIPTAAAGWRDPAELEALLLEAETLVVTLRRELADARQEIIGLRVAVQGADRLVGQARVVRHTLEEFLDRERATVDELAGLLRLSKVEEARWRERAETLARMEEAEFVARCAMAGQLRVRGLDHLVVEPVGVR